MIRREQEARRAGDGVGETASGAAYAAFSMTAASRSTAVASSACAR